MRPETQAYLLSNEWDLPEGTEKKHEMPQSRYSPSRLRSESVTFRLAVRDDADG
jgi:hypothetical protein